MLLSRFSSVALSLGALCLGMALLVPLRMMQSIEAAMTNADGAAPEASSLLPQALAGIAGGLIFSLGVLFSATKSTRFPAKLLRLIGGTGLLLAVIFLGYSFGGLGRAFSKLAAAETVDVVEFSDLLEAMSFPTVMGIGLFFLASVSLGVSRLFLESEMKRHRFAGLAAIAFGAALTLAMIWLSYSAMGYESTLSKGAGIQPAVIASYVSGGLLAGYASLLALLAIGLLNFCLGLLELLSRKPQV